MEPSVYIDILFLINWGMDTFLLWCAGRIAGFRTKRWRIFLGGFLSAMLYCAWFCLFRKNGGFFSSLFLLFFGLAVAYFPKKGKNMLRLMGAVLAASFLLSGVVTILIGTTQTIHMLGNGFILRKQYPWYLLLWSVGMAYILLKIGGKWLEANIQRRREYCTAVIIWNQKKTEGRMLIDTGNGLRQKDGRGVAVIEIATILPLFTPEEQVVLLSEDRRYIDLEYLSFTSLGNADGKLYGIRADQLLLSFGEQTIVHKNIFIGISWESFTGSYEGLVPPCLLEEE